MSGESLPPARGAAARPSPSSEVARRILTRGALVRGAQTDSGTPETAISSLQRSCTHVTDALRSSIGDAGCDALFARAFAHTECAHPLLGELRPHADQGFRLDGIAASVAAHDIESVTAAIEALIAAVIDILARLVGDDMAFRLLDNDGPHSPTRGGAREP